MLPSCCMERMTGRAALLVNDVVVGMQGERAADTRQLLFTDPLHQLGRSRHFVDIADRPDGVEDDLNAVGEEERALIEGGCSTAIATGRGEGGAEAGVELLLPRAAAGRRTRRRG